MRERKYKNNMSIHFRRDVGFEPMIIGYRKFVGMDNQFSDSLDLDKD
jgi:hypothetical protein